MRKAGSSIAVILLFGASLLLALVRMQRTQDLAYLEGVVGPSFAECVLVEDQDADAESTVVAAGSVRSSEWSHCRGDLGLRRILAPSPSSSPTSLGLRDDLEGALRPPPVTPGAFIAAGCASSGTAWLMLVDSSAERFWLQIRHTDLAGDPPACIDIDAYLRAEE